jgi:carbon-monoxide dehydrogenase medium subunit
VIPTGFEYAAPSNLNQAFALLQKHGEDAKILTGGHSLIPLMKLRLARPAMVIDLRKIKRLSGIHKKQLEPDKTLGLEIGAATTHAEIQRSEVVRKGWPLLAETAGEIGDVQVRNAGTIGGSVVHADPAADWPAALLACGATLVLASTQGERTLAAEDFFVGLLESAIRPGEILVAIRFPGRAKDAQAGGAYRKLAQSASGFALAGAAVELTVAGLQIATARVGITGVAERAYRPTRTEQALTGCALEENAIRNACAFAAEGIEPLADIHAGARYRASLARVLARRAVLAAVERARGNKR